MIAVCHNLITLVSDKIIGHIRANCSGYPISSNKFAPNLTPVAAKISIGDSEGSRQYLVRLTLPQPSEDITLAAGQLIAPREYYHRCFPWRLCLQNPTTHLVSLLSISCSNIPAFPRATIPKQFCVLSLNLTYFDSKISQFLSLSRQDGIGGFTRMGRRRDAALFDRSQLTEASRRQSHLGFLCRRDRCHSSLRD